MSGHCIQCGSAFLASRSDKQFCTTRCRVRYHRSGKRSIGLPGEGERQRLLDRYKEVVGIGKAAQKERESLARDIELLLKERDDIDQQLGQQQKKLSQCQLELEDIDRKRKAIKPPDSGSTDDRFSTQLLTLLNSFNNMAEDARLKGEYDNVREKYNATEAAIKHLETQKTAVNDRLNSNHSNMLSLDEQLAQTREEYLDIRQRLGISTNGKKPGTVNGNG